MFYTCLYGDQRHPPPTHAEAKGTRPMIQTQRCVSVCILYTSMHVTRMSRAYKYTFIQYSNPCEYMYLCLHGSGSMLQDLDCGGRGDGGGLQCNC